jgi:outer membrane protein assembly factor BamE (lipoprotein component of BamABCDE complex)
MLRRIFLVMMLAMLAACSNMNGGSGEDKMSMDYLKQHLIVGQTTKAQVQELFGTPGYKAEKPDGADYWSYDEDQINGKDMVSEVAKYVPGLGSMGSAAANSQARKTARQLSIGFNKNGTVNRFEVSGHTGASS